MPDVVVVNATTGEVSERAFTPEEKAQRGKDKEDYEKLQKAEVERARKRKDAEDRVKAKAKTDPDFAAIVELLGI